MMKPEEMTKDYFQESQLQEESKLEDDEDVQVTE